ncbi:hypothetical protein CIB93_24520 [Streptomyces sp. WZ.A104]|uniref:hypothetical protein n=1 Tax=Streptomyces sp. WZ.A104 TaxID=2023771 RepID=UPI000BBCE04D|nr:hypothetical protein [Streptomyces sp. WZ.A104]PCG83411.1 hypothetical protein CIB93_24520 [Streptomyces sp. WZ.A104]
MADESGLEGRLADLASSGQRYAAPQVAEQVRARGDRRRRRKRAARASGGVVMAAALAMGVLSVTRLGPEAVPSAAKPTAAASVSLFVPPTPAPGEEYASELGFVYHAVSLKQNMVQVTVAQVRTGNGVAVPTGVVHKVTLKPETPVEVEHVAGGEARDMRVSELVDRLRTGPQWVFALDYDGEGRVQSLREAHWLTTD